MTTGYVDSTSYNKAKWCLEYTEGTPNMGVTEVSYRLITTGREKEPSPTAYTTFCHMKIYDINWNLLIQEDFEWPTTIKSFTGQERATGSFNVYHNNSGIGKFIVTFNVAFHNDTINNPDGYNNEATVTISQRSYSYTACSAPTSVTASGLVAPNGEVTVSWSGASGGISNSISGYDVYWRITSEGYGPSTGINSGTKEIELNKDWKDGEGEATINIGEATRGHTVVFGVVTKGSAGSSYYSRITTGGSVKVNSLPTKPLGGTVSPTLVPASGGTVTFNITPGTDSDGQTVGLKYATSATGEKIPCSSSFSLSVVGAGTYYFWSNDGLEDSADYYAVSVSSNTKPTVTIEVKGTQLETVNTLSDATYILNPTITLTKGDNGQQDNNTYNYYIHYSTDNSSWTKKALWENDSSLTKTIDDVRALGYFTNLATTSYYYYFSATRNDGMDTSNTVNTSSTKYYASKRPSLLGMYNTQNYQNINLSEFQGYFSKALSFEFERDTGYNSLKIFSGATQVGTISLTAASDGLRGQWLGINLTKGSYSFTGELGHAANNFYTSINLGSFYKIENLEAKNLTASSDFQVYTSGVTYDFSIYNTFNVSYSELTPNKYKEYGISDISSSFYARLTVDSAMGKTWPLTIAQKTVNGNLTTNDTLFFSLTAAQLYAMLPDISNKNKTYQGILTVGFTDVFGTDTSTSINYTVNYGVTPQVTSCSIKVNNSKEVNTWEYLKEGMPLTINGTVESYNTNPKIQIQINRIKNGAESGYVNFGSPIDLASDSSISGIELSQGIPVTYTFSNQKIITVGELIELDYQVNFRVKVITDADSKYHYTGSNLYARNIKVCGHTSQGAVTLNEADYSSTEVTRATSYLNYRYTNNHPGALTITDNSNYSLTLTAKLEYRNIANTDWSSAKSVDIDISSLTSFLFYSGVRRSVAFVFPEGTDAFVCRLVLTTTQTVTNGTQSYTTTKTVYTNEQAVYNVLPTVSYRKNLLGINASNLDNYENVVIVVGEHSSKNIIYLVSSTGVKKINTSTGDLDGFTIECGKW